jgi:hypothetical protein
MTNKHVCTLYGHRQYQCLHWSDKRCMCSSYYKSCTKVNTIKNKKKLYKIIQINIKLHKQNVNVLHTYYSSMKNMGTGIANIVGLFDLKCLEVIRPVTNSWLFSLSFVRPLTFMYWFTLNKCFYHLQKFLKLTSEFIASCRWNKNSRSRVYVAGGCV